MSPEDRSWYASFPSGPTGMTGRVRRGARRGLYRTPRLPAPRARELRPGHLHLQRGINRWRSGWRNRVEKPGGDTAGDVPAEVDLQDPIADIRQIDTSAMIWAVSCLMAIYRWRGDCDPPRRAMGLPVVLRASKFSQYCGEYQCGRDPPSDQATTPATRNHCHGNPSSGPLNGYPAP